MTFGVLALIVLAGLAGPLLASGKRALVPVVVGELVAGVVIGISGFRWLDPARWRFQQRPPEASRASCY